MKNKLLNDCINAEAEEARLYDKDVTYDLTQALPPQTDTFILIIDEPVFHGFSPSCGYFCPKKRNYYILDEEVNALYWSYIPFPAEEKAYE